MVSLSRDKSPRTGSVVLVETGAALALHIQKSAAAAATNFIEDSIYVGFRKSGLENQVFYLQIRLLLQN